MTQIQLYDTTLRDGMQGEGMSLSAEEKLRVAHRLDELGIDLIEAGFPSSNPKELPTGQSQKIPKTRPRFFPGVRCSRASRHADRAAPLQHWSALAPEIAAQSDLRGRLTLCTVAAALGRRVCSRRVDRAAPIQHAIPF